MSSFDIKPGEKTLCQELNTDKGYTGFFYFDVETICAEICSYDEFFYLSPEKPIFLRAENNAVVSLHSNVASRPGSSSRREPKMVTYKQRIISNTAVIGHNQWQQTDSLKSVRFLARHVNELLKHQGRIEKIAQAKIGDEFESELFSETTNGVTVRALYGARFSFELNVPRDILPYLEIEFAAGATLFEYLAHVECVVQFFSLSLGAYMTPSDIRICRLSRAEMLAAVEAQTYPGDYSVQYIWRQIPVEDTERWVGGSLVMTWDDEELAALQQCLVVWIERHAAWKKANTQMMVCLASKREISADRLLAACKWFEEIPLTKRQPAITDEHVQIIADAAAEKASQLGYAKIDDRIVGAVKSVKSELNEELFSRLLDRVKEKFGPSIVDDMMIVHLKRALDFRGKSAHGHFSPSDEIEFRRFEKSIYAMEALCFLLTACDLPINANGLERAQSNPFIRDYHLSWESPV